MRKSPDIDLQCILFDHLTKPHKTKPHASVLHFNFLGHSRLNGMHYVTLSDMNTWLLNICNVVLYQ